MLDWTQSLESLEREIRRGDGAAAGARLGGLPLSRAPREHRARLAALARRLGQHDLGLRLLYPLVRPAARRPVEATPEEKLQYAACLDKIGASGEALEILNALDPAGSPQVLLHRAFARISVWDYAAAIPVLNEYLERVKDPYALLVGKVNLLSALVYERCHGEAERIAAEVLLASMGPDQALVRGKCLQLVASDRVLRGEPARAREPLEEAARLVGGTPGLDAFFVRKWTDFRICRELGGAGESESRLAALRQDALKIRHWESVRDCDRFHAILTGDRARFLHLWFGTPHEGFRRWLLHDFPERVPLPDFYDWQPLGPGGAKFELARVAPRTARSEALLAARILASMLCDFYRPVTVAELHAEIYPGEYFNPISSPARVKVALRRFGAWLKTQRLPLGIAREKGFLGLYADAACRVRIPRAGQTPALPMDRVLGVLHERLGGARFTSSAASAVLKVSLRTAIRVLNEAAEAGRAEREGTGRATRYRLVA